jgi:hypothetical protein
MCWADGRTALGLRQSACKAKRPVSGWGQGRQPPEAVARSASLEPSRSQVYVNTVAPRRRIRLVTVAAGLMALPIRSDQCRHRQLDTSNGCQNHTVLPYATTRLRQKASPGSGVVRLARPPIAHEVHPALRPPLPADALASTTSRPTFVTTRDRPSCRNGMAGDRPLIWGFGEAEFCPSR